MGGVVSSLRVMPVVGALALVGSGCGLLERADRDAARAEPTAPATAPRPPGEPSAVAAEFLAAWAAGDDDGAAQLTDAPVAATEVLAGVRAALPIEAIGADPHPVPGRPEVPFTVNVALRGIGFWSYESKITVVAEAGRWRVAWAPSVIHPRLTAGGTFVLTPSPSGSANAVVLDRTGTPLVPAEHPSLAPTILPAIARVGPATTGRPGMMVQVRERTGGLAPLEKVIMADAGGATVASTLDAGIQAAAQRAISATPAHGALVVIQPSTGNILALANNPPAQRYATHAARPPGSTFKVIVASALLAAGDTPQTPVPCPAELTLPQGRRFTNDSPSDTDPGATLAKNFAVSCNTAFVARGMEKLTPGGLLEHASAVFGLGARWDIGLGDPTTYWSLPNPGANRDLFGEDLIGQGTLTMEPLALASVAATASSGTFRQPILVPGTRQAPAARRAPSDGLRQMMRQVVRGGTADTLAGLPGDVGAKTGTGDVAGGNANWLIAYRDDLAVACLIQGFDDTRGNATAGPVVASLLRSI